ncbi:MAG TPA: chemotaxis protein CheW [Syntrophales bacterium]|nr:chemotaxis protein CheW [Syntrophales bacterium]
MQYASSNVTGERTPQEIETKNTGEGKYLTFSLRGEEYGIEIIKVKEIIGIMNITTIPQTPAYVRGVINLRGKVIPVIDLRLKFGMEESPYTDRTCIVVVDIYESSKGNFFMGIIVDSVSEVINIRGEEIEKTPSFGVSLRNDYFIGMAKVKDAVKLLLDIDRVVVSDMSMAGTLIQ